MKIKNLFAGIIASILLISPISSIAQGNYSQMIKVGLYYANTAKSSYTLGNSALNVYEGDSLIANINSWGKYTVTVASKIYTTGEYFNDYSLAANSAGKLAFGFVYYDGTYYYAASSNLGADVNETLAYSESIIISCDEKPIFAFSTKQDISLSNTDDTFTIEGNSYRGKLILKAEASKIKAINYVDIDEYLKGVVGREMSASWEMEALKAQAVVARNFALKSINKHSSEGFNICTTTHCQVYGGIKSEANTVNQAVESTKGQLMYYNGEIAEAYYSSSSGGKTENNENVWGAGAIPYLRGVDDPYSIGYPNDNWTIELTGESIKSALLNKGVDIGEIADVKITKTSQMGRAIELTVLGTKGSKVFTKDGIRSSIAKESLKSTLFTITKISDQEISNINEVPSIYLPSGLEGELHSAYTNLNQVLPKSYSLGNTSSTKYVINGHGWGHGVGMSQYGAKDMAKKGYGYQDILKYYFTGVEIR